MFENLFLRNMLIVQTLEFAVVLYLTQIHINLVQENH